MARQVREIKVGPTPGAEQALKRISSQLGIMNRQVGNLGTSSTIFNRAFSGLFAFFGTRQLMNFADEIQMTQDRMNSLLGSVEKGNAAFAGLVNIAERSRASVGALGTIFNRVAISTQRLGIDTQTMLDITETLQNSFRISGATQQEAVATTIQLSQAFQSTALQGQELRSVMEQNAPLARLILDNFSRPGETIFKTAETGAIRINKLIPLILAQQEEWQRKAQEIGITYDQAITIALDKLKIRVSQVNRELGLTEKFFKSITFLVDNLDSILAGAGFLLAIKTFRTTLATIPPLIALMTTRWQQFTAIFLATVGLAKTLTINFTAFLVAAKGLGFLPALGLAILTPFTLLVGKIVLIASAIGAAIFAIYQFRDAIRDTFASTLQLLGIENSFTRDLQVRQVFEQNRLKWQQERLSMLRKEKMTAEEMDSFEKSSLDRARELVNLQRTGSVGSVSIGANLFQPLNRGLEGRGPLRDLGTANLNNITDPQNIIASATPRGPRNLNLASDDAAPRELRRLELRRKLLSELNQEIIRGRLSVGDYQRALMDFDMTMMNFDLNQGNTSYFEKLKLDNEQALASININLREGTLSLEQFFRAADNNAIEKLSIDLDEAKINIIDFRRQVFGLRGDLNSLSASNWAEALGIAATNSFEKMRRTGEQMVNVLEGAFDSLSDTIVEGIKKNDIAWNNFLQGVLDGVAKIIIQQQIVNPIASGIGQFLGAGSSAGAVGAGATGSMGSFPVAFKAADIGPQVASPQMNVVVNNMSSDVEVETQQKTDENGFAFLEMIIKNKVQQSLSDGSLDRAMVSNYGVRRKGF